MRFFRKAHPLENTIGYKFRKIALLQKALTHPSIVEERIESNQRLEFLGDAVLELCVSAHLFNKFPGMSEGELTEHRRKLVQRSYLAKRAENLEIFQYLHIGESEKKMGKEAKSGILADAYEALLGAVYLDGGISTVNRLIKKIHLKGCDEAFKSDEFRNYKGELLEYAQNIGMHPDYRLEDVRGAKHSQVFSSAVWLEGKKIGEGSGTSKKSAEQMAARVALNSNKLPRKIINN